MATVHLSVKGTGKKIEEWNWKTRTSTDVIAYPCACDTVNLRTTNKYYSRTTCARCLSSKKFKKQLEELMKEDPGHPIVVDYMMYQLQKAMTEENWEEVKRTAEDTGVAVIGLADRLHGKGMLKK